MKYNTIGLVNPERGLTVFMATGKVVFEISAIL